MATKDNHELLFKDKQNNVIDNGQYNNFTLNKNHQISSDAFSECSKSDITERRKALDYDFTNDSETKKEFHSWKKSTKNLSLNFANKSSEKEEGLKNGKALNASTLSLYIEAYENLNEANLFDATKEGSKKNDLIKKGLIPKQIDFDSTVIIQNPFEFPRQQETGEVVTPEIAQYSASQQLLNPTASFGLRPQQQLQLPQSYNPQQSLGDITTIAGMVLLLVAISTFLVACCISNRRKKEEKKEKSRPDAVISKTYRPSGSEWIGYGARMESNNPGGRGGAKIESRPLRNLSAESDVSRSMVGTHSQSNSISDDIFTT